MTNICHICLSDDKDLKHAEETLNEFHRQLCDYGIENHQDVCYCTECIYLLKKFYKFKYKCQIANTLLKDWKLQNSNARMQIKHLKSKLPQLYLLSYSDEKNQASYAIYNEQLKKDDIGINTQDDTLPTALDTVSTKAIDKKPGFITIDLTPTSLSNNDNRTDLDKQYDIHKDESANVISDYLDPDKQTALLIFDKHVVKLEAEDDDNLNIAPNGLNSTENDTVKDEDQEKLPPIRPQCWSSEPPLKDECKSVKKIKKDDAEFDIDTFLDNVSYDSSDDEVLLPKRKVAKRKVINRKEVKRKVVKRKIKTVTKEESESFKIKAYKRPKLKDLKEVKLAIERKFKNGDMMDKSGNVVDKDCILDNLEVMHKYTYNKIKRYFLAEGALPSEAIDFLITVQKRYGKEYSSVFVTQHLTTTEEIMDEFRNRMTYESYIKSDHKCTLCYRGFKYEKLLTNHMAEFHSPNKPFKCDICEMRFNRVQGLWGHTLSHRVVYRCKLCPLITNHRTVMKTHHNIHKGVKYPCPKCDSVFKSPPALAAHMNGVHQTKIICPICARSFNTDFGLHQHKIKKHSNETEVQGSVKCESCDISFVSDEVYQKHLLRTHSADKTRAEGGTVIKKRKKCLNRKRPEYTCRVCGAVESSMGGLVWHFNSNHPNEDSESMSIAKMDGYKYLCHECGKGFGNVTALSEHKNTHTGAKPYVCPKCSKAFPKMINLKNHMDYHEPPKRECPHCGKKFISQSNLSNHIRVHTGIRRYVCDVCSKDFLYRSTLNAHIRGVHLHIRRTRKRNDEPGLISHM